MRSLSLSRLYLLIFSAVFCTFVAAVVPNFPSLHGGLWGYAVFYELLAAILFVIAYGAVAYSVARPVKVSGSRVERFSLLAARMLTETNEEDHVALLEDLELSLPVLLKLSNFGPRRNDVSAFYLFTHRHKLQQAAWASSILRVFSDQHFCRSVVVKAPWRVASLLHGLSDMKLYSRDAERFVQELSYQALFAEASIMEREIGHSGLGEAPVLSQALYDDSFVSNAYRPLDINLLINSVTASAIKRYNFAAGLTFERVIKDDCLLQQRRAYPIQEFYKTAGYQIRYSGETNAPDIEFSSAYRRGIRNAVILAGKLMAAAKDYEYELMFAENSDRFRNDPLEALVNVVFDALCAISNEFKGFSDENWLLAVDLITDVFPPYSEQPDGLNPFQQRLALKFVKKLNDNMNGYYPAICRVLLPAIGPFDRKGAQNNLTAFKIIHNLLYLELKKLPDMAVSSPDKVSNYLPDNISYNKRKKALVHVYRGGSKVVTRLKKVDVKEIDLYSQEIKRAITDDEREYARQMIF